MIEQGLLMAQIHLGPKHVKRSIAAPLVFDWWLHPCCRGVAKEVMHVAIQTQLLTVSEAAAFQIHSHHVALHLCALGHRIMHHDLWKSFLSYLSALRSL